MIARMVRLTLIGFVFAAVAVASPSPSFAADFNARRIDRALETEAEALGALAKRLAAEDPDDLPSIEDALTAGRETIDALNDEVDAERARLEAIVADAPAAPRAPAGDDDAEQDAADADGAAAEDASAPPEDAEAAAAAEAARAAAADAQEALEALAPLAAEAASAKAFTDRLEADLSAQQRLTAVQADVDGRRSEIEDAVRVLEEAAPDADLLALRERLRALRDKAQMALGPIDDRREAASQDLDGLGDPPTEDAPAERPEIAAERAALLRELAREDAIIGQITRNVGEINRLLEDVTILRREQFYDQIFSRGPSPLTPGVLKAAAAAFSSGADRAFASAREWRASVDAGEGLNEALTVLALSAGLALLLFGPARHWANARVLSRLEKLEPTPGRRVGAALVRILARAVPGVIGGAILLEALKHVGLVDPTSGPLARSLWIGFVALLVADAGASAALSPRTPGWRLLPLAPVRGQFVRFMIVAMVFIYFADRALSRGAALFGGGQELALAQGAVIALAFGLSLIAVTQKTVWVLAEGREDAFSDDVKRFGRHLRRILRALAVVIIVAAVIGYVALAYYLATRVFLLGALVGAALFVRVVAHEALRAFFRAADSEAKSGVAGEDGEESLAAFWIGAVFDLTLLLVVTPVVFLILGADWADVRDAVRDAIFGFKIGNFTISLAQIFLAVIVFAAVLGVTRFVQRTGEKQFFPRTRLDIGVQNSLKTLIGYVGLIIAGMAAVSVLGFNLSNLAIIAGALSVGIGFGLQSIVNNFVSGLILLFERPIKVGDWIVTDSGQGIVKRISVRSTEIQTFDRASVIVPNSELISGAVTNWTHKDKIGRVIIPIGVSYDSDPELVIKLLEEVAKESPVLMSYPAAYVYFDGFGDSSIDLQLRGFIRDVNEGLGARTKLRVAIFKKLRDAGVEIPFPQRDLNIKTPGGDRPAADLAAADLAAWEQLAAQPGKQPSGENDVDAAQRRGVAPSPADQPAAGR